MTATLKRLHDYLRTTIRYAEDDSLERAQAAFRGMSPEDMRQQHGLSGRTRQEVLDAYQRQRDLSWEALAYLEDLLKRAEEG